MRRSDFFFFFVTVNLNKWPHPLLLSSLINPKPLGDHSGHLKGQDRHWGWKKRGREREMSLVDFWISSDVKDFFMDPLTRIS